MTRGNLCGRSRLWGVLSFAVLAVSTISCSGSKPHADVKTTETLGALTTQVLQSGNGDHYVISKIGREFVVKAPQTISRVKVNNLGGFDEAVVREAFWNTSQAKSTDQQVCVVMHSPLAPQTMNDIERLAKDRTVVHLNGVVLRLDPGIDGSSVRAIVVSQTLGYGALDFFSVDGVSALTTEKSTVMTVSDFGTLQFSDSIGALRHAHGTVVGSDLKPPPWSICARIIGTELTVKVWPTGSREPGWSDTKAVKSKDLGPGWVYPGYGGGYIAALNPGQQSTFSDLSVTSPY